MSIIRRMSVLVVVCLALFTTISYEAEANFEVDKVEVSKSTSRQDDPLVSNSGLEIKDEVNAGETRLIVNGDLCDQYTQLNLDGDTITSSSCAKSIKSSNDESFLVDKKGKVVFATEGLVSTIGGTSAINYMYSSIEDAYNQENGVPITGAAADGYYITTEVYNEQVFVEVNIGGYNGYMNIDDVQIIPSNYVETYSYYTNEDGYLVLYIANDPLNEQAGYERVVLQFAPDWMNEGDFYYSEDSENYYTNPYTRDENTKSTSDLYFANVPIRSTSKYNTSSAMKSAVGTWVTNSGHSTSYSKYYNSTQSFIDAENKKQINSLLLFVWANHESAYGTSTYARTCNNFFGRGAVDSDPDKACQKYGFDTAKDGILSQATWLGYSYTDIKDWRYYGDHFGNKQSGLNVKYASDPNWGNKLQAMAFDFDQKYLDGKEYEYYKIGKVKNNSNTVYTNSARTTPLKVVSEFGDESNYKITRNTTDKYGYAYPRVILTRAVGDSYEIQLPTSINNSSSTTCKQSKAEYGAYPGYNGYISQSGISKGTANFLCDYGDFTKQRGWIAKSAITENSESSNEYNKPGETENPFEDICPNYISTQQNSDGTYVDIYKNSDQSIKCNVYYNNQNVMYKTSENHYSNGKITTAEIINYYSNEAIKNKTNRTYYSNGNIKYSETREYNTSGSQTKRRYYNYNSSGIKTSAYSADYKGSTPTRTNSRNYTYYSNGTLKTKEERTYYSSGKTSYKEIRQYNSSGTQTARKYYKYDSSQVRTSAYSATYNNGQRTHSNTYTYKNGKLSSKDTRDYYTNGNVKYKEIRTYNSSGTKTTTRKVYNYNSSGKLLDSMSANYDSNQKRTRAGETDYYSNGKMKQFKEKTYKNGKLYKVKCNHYNTSGKMTSSNTTYY